MWPAILIFRQTGSRHSRAAAGQSLVRSAHCSPCLQRSASTSSAVGTATPTASKPTNLYTAINDALHSILTHNPRALVFGEDVGFGGVFRCTIGLQEKFGRDRVFNTPISEQGIVGFAIGAAAQGMTPIAEIQFADYIHPAFDQFVNEAAKYRYRSGGAFDCGGMTVRAPYGAVGHGGHYHSQSPEACYTHVPGVRVVVPSGPREAKGLLLASVQHPDPVVFFEAKMMYRTVVEEVPTEDYTISLGEARLARTGSDVTIVAWGQQVAVAERAAAEVADSHGISCEVIDLRSLLPWDRDTVESSVNKTGRLLVVHEAPITSGFGAEIVAALSKRCFLRLESPPLRVCGYDTPFPLVYEPLYVPSVPKVVDAIHESIKF